MENGPIFHSPFSILAVCSLMNLPNGLTVARIIVTPGIAALPFVESSGARLVAFLLFLAAAITDAVGGTDNGGRRVSNGCLTGV